MREAARDARTAKVNRPLNQETQIGSKRAVKWRSNSGA
jgi:hypothetical protein